MPVPQCGLVGCRVRVFPYAGRSLDCCIHYRIIIYLVNRIKLLHYNLGVVLLKAAIGDLYWPLEDGASNDD